MRPDSQPTDIDALNGVEPAGSPSPQPLPKPSDRWYLIPLILIILLGAYFRFVGIDWDGTQHLHPDERFLTETTGLLATTFNPLEYLRTSESPLNPHNVGKTFYVYGNFPMTVVRYASEWIATACTDYLSECDYNYGNYNGIHIVGRYFSGLLDLVSIGFLFLIGRRLYDWRVGLLAALLQALAVMPIQQAHFYTMDNWAAGLTTVTMYCAVRASEDARRIRWWILFGTFLGLTVSSRINMAPLAAMAGVAAIVWLSRQNPQWSTAIRTSRGAELIQTAAIGVIVAAFVSMLVFRVAQPYAFADANIVREEILVETGREPNILTTAVRSIIGPNPAWLANLEEIQRLQQPDASFPPANQWTARTKMVFPLTNMILYGMGITASLMSFVGFLFALWRIVQARPEWQRHLLPVSWIALYFVFMGTRWVQSIRYFLPLYPFFFLLGSWLLFRLWDKAAGRQIRRLAVGVLVAAVVLPSFLWANAFVQIYQEPVTRIAASRWMLENVPSAATLIYEVDGIEEEMQLPARQLIFFGGNIGSNIQFTAPVDAVVTGIRFNYLRDTDGGDDSETLIVGLTTEAGSEKITVPLDLGDEREAVHVSLGKLPIIADMPYQISLESGTGGPFEGLSSVMANEHWDDPLPTRVDGLDPYGQFLSGLPGGTLPVTHPDSEDKKQQILSWMDDSDYIVLSSQRAVWSLPRLPLTFPLMMVYYEGLFNEELGFELVAEFHADLHVGPLYISDTGGEINWGSPPSIGWPPPGDSAAEEAFSVYDHPPVWIFAKTDEFDINKVEAALNAVDLSRQITMTPGQATQARNGLLLSPEAQLLQRENGTFAERFNVDGFLSQRPAMAAVVWWLAVILLGWLTFPITFVVFRGLASRGYILSRILSLLLLSYFGWITASLGLLPHNRATLLLGLALLTATSIYLVWRHGHAIVTFVRQKSGFIIAVELLALILFLILIVVRLGNPDVWDVIWGGEKPMDLSYFNAVLKSTSFPPYDPWYAGGYINYYYYGFVYVGSLTLLMGIVPTVAYNLILPMLFSFTGMGAFSIAYNLVAWQTSRQVGSLGVDDGGGKPAGFLKSLLQTIRSKAFVAGLVAAMLCVLLGNLGEPGVFLTSWQRAGSPDISNDVLRTLDGALKTTIGGEISPLYPGDWFWTASRALNYNPGEAAPITEFPFFTFLYGDLHAHMISMPLMLLALAWAVAYAMQKLDDRIGLKRTNLFEKSLTFVIGALAIGVLRATNTWDWPTYLVLGSLAVTLYAYRAHGEINLKMVGQAAVSAIGLVALSTLSFLPFAQNYGQAYASLALWPGSYSQLSRYLVVYGLFLFIIITYLLYECRSWFRAWSRAGMARLEPIGGLLIVTLLSGSLALILLLAVMLRHGYKIVPFVLPLVLIAGLLGLRRNLPVPRRITLILTSAALALTLAVEIVVVEGDIGRMNMVFKFYVQVWLILSVIAGAAFAWIMPSIQRRAYVPRMAWRSGLVLLIAIAALYPIFATRAKWQIRMSDEAPTTLDGMAFMETTSYGDTNATVELKHDYDAIQWMYRNIDGSPVVAEAHSGNPYRSIGNRVSMYTGLPSIVGWDWHQRQQRAVLPGWVVSDRIADVSVLFNSQDTAQKMSIIDEYEVGYIYAGTLEWIYYDPQGLNQFDSMVADGLLQEVYRNSHVTIYKVVGN